MRLLGQAAVTLLTIIAGCSSMQPAAEKHVRSTPETVVWGEIPAGRAPVARVRQGETVSIDTVSHQGIINGMDPVKFFAAGGIAPQDVLADARDIYARGKKGASVHVLTGPIYVEGAEPGDVLEVRMIDFRFRTPYGVNNSGKGAGVLPDLHGAPYPKIIRLDTTRRVALFAPGIEIPLQPFMGIMAVEPPQGLPNTRPPGAYGGNMDFNRLTTGASLFLPVYHAGGLFYTGDSHAVQGDGEVNGTAIEASLTPVLQFFVHKGAARSMKWPRAEDANNYYITGMDRDLDTALKEAVQETVTWLQRERGLSVADAYSLASVGVNFIVAEAVDDVQVVYAAIPKKLFATNAPYWQR
jgi:acetamidase/formamidase